MASSRRGYKTVYTMLIQFPGCPDRFRALLAEASLDRLEWTMFLRHLEHAFPGLLVSTEEVTLAPGSQIPVFAMVGSRVGSHAGDRYWHLGLGNPERGTLLSEPNFIEGDRTGIRALLLDCDDKWLRFLIARMPEDRQEMYRRPLEVLLAMLADDISDAYRTATFRGLDDVSLDRTRLETQWDRIERPVALISSDLRIHGLNAAMIDMLDDRKLFRPSKAHDRLRPTAALDHDRLHETVDDLARGRRQSASVTIGKRCREIAIDLRTASASAKSSPQGRGRIIATIAM